MTDALRRTTDRMLVFIPTYNEKDNAERLCREILRQDLAADILFVDDNSTDGTGDILDTLARELECVKVVHRAGKLGIGSAHRAGIAWAYEHGYRTLVTMDCDFTHDPSRIPALVAKGREGFDVVVGSRYLQDRSLEGWNPFRKTLTHLGHWMTRVCLGMSYDATNAFRYYDLRAVPSHLFVLVASQGYSFFFESLYVLHRNRYRIGEIPIALPNRTYGHSKMDLGEIRNSLRLLVVTCFKAFFNPEKFEVGEDFSPADGADVPKDEQGWDSYWENQKKAGGLLYDAIAAFYRKFIIRPSLNRFVDRHFRPGAEVLHAGCGSGQVDSDIRSRVSITGLDLSVNALRLYLRVNKGHCKVLHGSIFDIPRPDGSVEGIYNLGVMEHFTEEEIQRILREFHRVLKKEGRIVLFWPPEFGLSVLFFKTLTVIFGLFGKKNVKFHPDEITRVRSRAHVNGILEQAAFKVVEYSFGPRDLFTYAVIAAEKRDSVALPSIPVAARATVA
jgi:dolichol-phosphate mannosyltransferase